MPRAKKLSALKPDPRNANRGTKKGRELLDASIRDLGFGRSILTDRDGTVIAGNKTMAAALAANPDTKVRVIDTDGSELVVVRRTDLNLETDPKAKRLAIADNRVSELDLSWDQDVLSSIGEEVDLKDLFPDLTPAAAGDSAVPEGSYREQFGVIVICADAKEQEAVFLRLQKEGLTVRVVTT